MPDYILMVMENEDEHAAQTPLDTAALIRRRADFVDGLRREGRLRDHGRFRPSKEAKRARHDGERLRIWSGPFVGESRAMGAYYWVEGVDLDEATKLAAACPGLASDQVDVRPVMKGKVVPDKEGRSGKIFGFVVLGKAPSEGEWVQAMDRIDAETHRSLPDSFLGGVRLEKPTSGRRVATHEERRAMFDGPFLESKEVIGGLFFVRATSVDDAVRWAEDTRHGVHGALEIRELWRT